MEPNAKVLGRKNEQHNLFISRANLPILEESQTKLQKYPGMSKVLLIEVRRCP